MKFSVLLLASTLSGLLLADALEESFRNPPASAKPHTWYHLMNGNATKAGITRDFEALAEVGVGGVQMFDAGCAIPPGPIAFNSPEWFDLVKHAAAEARRLGLEVCLPNCSGWSSSGGPWNSPTNGMKFTCFTETRVKGPQAFSGKLPAPPSPHGFYEDIAVLAYPTPQTTNALAELSAKTFRERSRIASPSADTNVAVLARTRIVDLTSGLQKDGSFPWNVPAGDWTILRFGYAANGRHNHPASDHGRGLEVDKLSAEALNHHFDQYVAKICQYLGPLAGDVPTGLNNILVDSYEVGCQNWTQGFDKLFWARMGYSLKPYLPVFAGHVVGSVDESERFLRDFRRVVADLFAENYAGALAKKCHECGLKLSLEPYGNGPFDDLQYGEAVDIPMGEFWSRAPDMAQYGGNARLVAHLAHVWGRKFVGMEAFTANPKNGGRWLTTPYLIKAANDLALASGANRMIYHRFVHQPWADDKYLPGMTMGRWGMHFDRTQTWWAEAKEWIRYQTRAQFLLQQGTFVADVLFFEGEDAPNAGGIGRDRLPYGYNYDVCARAALDKLEVKDGRLVVPGGVSYRLLALPDAKTMTPELIKRIGALAVAGAEIVGVAKPERSPSLAGGSASDQFVKNVADGLWGKYVKPVTARERLRELQVEPDFNAADASHVAWIHRRLEDGGDLYFVASSETIARTLTCSFRTIGREPEFWDAETGVVSPASVWRVEGTRTVVDIPLRPAGSLFVLFRKPAAAPHYASAKVAVSPRPSAPRHTLVVEKAVYGAGGKTKDIAARLQAKVRGGRLCVCVDNALAGGDPAPMTPKELNVTYVLDGRRETRTINEFQRLTIAANGLAEPPDWEFAAAEKGLPALWAAQPLTAEVKTADGLSCVLKAAPPPPYAVKGAWQVSFPHGFYPNALADGPAEKLVFNDLVSWTARPEEGVRFFSGSAVYERQLPLGELKAEGGRFLLDLGDVHEFATVTIDGKTYPALWRPPYRLEITETVAAARAAGRKELALSVKVTNLWPNRLIGDDAKPADCAWQGTVKDGVREIGIKEIPQWVKDGQKSPTGRLTFTTWYHWTKDDKLLPSGLLGPVVVHTLERAR